MCASRRRRPRADAHDHFGHYGTVAIRNLPVIEYAGRQRRSAHQHTPAHTSARQPTSPSRLTAQHLRDHPSSLLRPPCLQTKRSAIWTPNGPWAAGCLATGRLGAAKRCRGRAPTRPRAKSSSYFRSVRQHTGERHRGGVPPPPAALYLLQMDPRKRCESVAAAATTFMTS